MIVEIHILSGSRQGERIELDRPEFRVGSEPGSQVHFDPAKDPHAAGRLAEFRFSEDDGWTLRKLGGGELLLNHQPILDVAHVRSGDVVRLSELGPDFTFGVLSRRERVPAPAEAEDRHVAQSLPPARMEAAAAASSPWAADVGRPVPVAPRPAIPIADAATPGAELLLMPVPETRGWKMPVLVAAGIMLGLIALVFWPRPASERPGAAAEVGEASEPAGAVQEPREGPPEQKSPPEPAPPAPPPAPELSASPEPKPDPDAPLPWPAVLEQVREAVFLIVVEDPTGQAAWPVANACAIRNDTLLTSGTAASAVASLREMKLDDVDLGDRKWSIWAQSATGLRRNVTAVQVHQGYEQLPDETEEAAVDPRMYFDLALLTLDEPVSAALAVADRPARGLPVAAVGIPYQSQPMSSFQSYAARLMEGQVTMSTHLDPQRPESPALLRVTAPIPAPDPEAMGPYQIGCPVIDRRGRLVGVYSSPGLTPQMQKGKMHYVVETRLIALWLDGKGLGSWVEPAAPMPPAPP